MIDRGFGIELEDTYGEIINKENFNLDWFEEANKVDFKLNDKPVTKSGGSRMKKRARAGILKPSGSTSADADLQKFAWYMRGYLDNYVFTEGNDVNTHEFYGGEGKSLQSFRGIAVYDMLKKYLYGLLIDGLKFEVSDESMNIDADWIYKTEEAGIIGENGETFERPIKLEDEDLFIMFYDVFLKLNNLPLDGVATSFGFEGANNHAVDNTIGLGSRGPQIRASAVERENKLSLVTTLTESTVKSILAAQYGEVGALEPSKCKILQIPLELKVKHYENPDLEMIILFPKCTLSVEYDMSEVDAIEVKMDLETLGAETVTLADGLTEVITDMYVKIKNNQGELGVNESPIIEGNPETENISITVQDSEEQPISGATVSIGQISSNTGVAGGCTLQNIPVGTQTIIVTKEGYQEYTDTISISSNDNSFTITLTE